MVKSRCDPRIASRTACHKLGCANSVCAVSGCKLHSLSKPQEFPASCGIGRRCLRSDKTTRAHPARSTLCGEISQRPPEGSADDAVSRSTNPIRAVIHAGRIAVAVGCIVLGTAAGKLRPPRRQRILPHHRIRQSQRRRWQPRLTFDHAARRRRALLARHPQRNLP